MKIFGLGFHKTGSTTLETALITLGYDAIGKQPQLIGAIKANNWDQAHDVIQAHDAFRDMPWPLYFRELDQRYPGSKFILTVRSSGKWLNSCKNHYKDIGSPVFKEIYGDGKHFPLGNEDHWLETYLLHNREVRAYFKDRPSDLLELNWEDGDGWEKLCTFLGDPIPSRDFPHANKGKYSLTQKFFRRIHYLIDKEGFKKRNRDL